MNYKVGIVSLGCAKNQVDAEMLLYTLKNRGFIIVNDPADADAVIVNTCGFIESAKQESINEIIELGKLKDEGKIKAIIVTGCLFGNICGKRSFSNPRRTVENKIRNISAFNNFTQRSVGCNKMLLSHNVINCLWTNPVRKRFVHNFSPMTSSCVFDVKPRCSPLFLK